MLCKEVFKCGDQKFGIMDTLILIRGTGFLFDNDIRMGFQKVLVIERDMTDDPKTISDNTELKDIAEMPIDI